MMRPAQKFLIVLALLPVAISERNERLLKTDPSMVFWTDWPDSLTVEAIRTRIESLSKRPQTALFKNSDEAVSEAEIDAWMDNLNLDGLQTSDNESFGLTFGKSIYDT